MKINQIFQSKIFQGIILGMASLIIVLFIFKAGIIVGIKKSDFSYKWSNNYHKNFAGPRKGFFNGFGDRDFMNAHGTFGQIIKIDGQTLVIKSNNDLEKIILIQEDTTINRFRDSIKPEDLKINEYVVIIGEPNESGQIEAKLIRVLPAEPKRNF